jgi:hypothetical protein
MVIVRLMINANVWEVINPINLVENQFTTHCWNSYLFISSLKTSHNLSECHKMSLN